MAAGKHVQGSASLTSAASGTVTVWSALSDGRFHITRANINVLTPCATGAGISFMETNSTGSEGATLFTINHTTISGTHRVDMGDHGWIAASIGSRLVMIEDGDATVNCVFVGYHR